MESETRLPYSDFPEDNICPFCDRKFASSAGLRGHAYHKHQTKWEPKPQKITAYAKRHALRELKDLQEISDLKPWHKVCIMQKVLFNTKFADIGKLVHKSDASCRKIFNSPAGQKYVEGIRDQMEDMPALLLMGFNSSLLGLAMHDAAALQMAIEERDYEFIHKFVTDHYKITKVIDDTKQPESINTPTLNITFEGSLDTPQIGTSHRVIEAEVVNEEPDGIE